MAGREWSIVLPAAKPEELWATLIELGCFATPESWVLVGGLMVQLHAMRSGLPDVRTTTDIDALVDLRVLAFGEFAQVLESLGFVAVEPNGKVFHRFRRENLALDVLVADDRARFRHKALLRPRGVRQAMARLDTYRLQTQSGERVDVLVPDSLGAVILKGCAYREDNRDALRHLDDVIRLLASAPVADLRDLALSNTDRQRLRRLDSDLARHPELWALLEPISRERARASWSRISAAVAS